MRCKKFLAVIIGVLNVFCAFAQIIPPSPNCPVVPSNSGVQIVGEDTSGCGLPITLTAAAFGISTSTESYNVSSVAYNPFPFAGGTQITSISTVDDVWSDSIPLPFDFCFFGQRFNYFIASSNGTLSFNTSQATGGSAWATGGWGPMPVATATSGGDFDYVIAGPHHDIDPGAGTATAATQVTYATYGVAPCRAFVVAWDAIPLFSCNNDFATQAIVLYESTNIIDIIIKEKTLCAGWNSGLAYQGIQDNGFNAFTVPGRNGTVWTDSNSTWRFSPNGTNPILTYQWVDLSTGAIIGNGSSIVVTPLVTTTYAVLAIGCPNTVVGTDTHTIYVIDPVTASFTSQVKLGCVDDTLIFDNTSQFALGYRWDFGDGSGSITPEPGSHVYINQGVYTVTLIASKGPLCEDTFTRVFDLRHPINAEFVVDTTICLYPDGGLNGSIAVGNFSIGGGIVSTFNFGDGTVVVHTNTSVVPVHNYSQPGIYTLTLSIVDTLGCVDTMRKDIYVEGIPFATASASDSTVCVGEVISFNDSITEMANSWQWVFPSGFTISDQHDPIYTFDIAGTNNITLTVNFLYCPSLSVNIPIVVGNLPTIDLGPDTAYCNGFSAPLALPVNSFGGISPGGTVNWNTGYVGPSLAVTAPGTYWATVQNTSGCSGADTIIVREDCYLNIPNAFTPGSEALNETFLPTGALLRGAVNYELAIYNRWGEQMFFTKNKESRGWDGKFGGKDQPMGVYVYTVKVLFKNGGNKTYSGNVTLIR